MGKGVLEGNGLGVSEGREVSVAPSVGVAEAVSVGAIVFEAVDDARVVGIRGSAGVGVELDVKLQANKAMVNRIGKRSFCLIV